ncbi:MAG: hypothetical protein WC100_04110 [Sterolibacterium sp.]
MSNVLHQRFANDFSRALPAASSTDWQGETHRVDEIALGDTNYSIEDSATALLAADPALLEAADAVTVTDSHAGTLRVAEYLALTELTILGYWGYVIEDSAPALLGADPAILESADYVALSGNDAGSLTLAEQETLAILTTDFDWTYSITDSVDNLMEPGWIESIISASSVSVAAGAAAAASLNAVDDLIGQVLDAGAVTEISGSAATIAQVVSAEGIDTAADVAATIGSGAALASDLGTIAANTSAVVDATAITGLSGTANQLAFILNFAGVNTAPDVAVTAEAGLAAASDLNGIDQKTTTVIDASMVTLINGVAAEIAVTLSSAGIDTPLDVAVAVNAGIVGATALATIDDNTSANVDARAVSMITGSADVIAAVIDSNGVVMAPDVAAKPDAGAATATDLISIDRHTTARLDASLITKITGTAAEILRVIGSSGILLAENFDAAVTGLNDSTEIATIEAANGSGTVSQAIAALVPVYLVATPATTSYGISSGIFENLIDCAGAQTFHVSAGGKLNLIGSDGHNLIVFDDIVPADMTLSRSGATAIFSSAADGTQMAWIATDWFYASAQTIAFSDGSQMELTLVGNSMQLGGVAVAEIGEFL